VIGIAEAGMHLPNLILPHARNDLFDLAQCGSGLV